MKLATFFVIVSLAVVPAALADEAVVYDLKLENHRFDPKTIKVPANRAFRIKLTNLDETPAELESKSLRIEKVVAGKSEITVSVKPLKPGSYAFYDEYHRNDAA